MSLISKVKLLFTYPGELEDVLKTLKEKKEEGVRLSRVHNLNLCYAHRQEHNHSHFSSSNCDYCKLLTQTKKHKFEVALAASPIVVGDVVTVYDRYRFAISVKGIVMRFTNNNNGVEVKLLTTNNNKFPAGELIQVSKYQCRKFINSKESVSP